MPPNTVFSFYPDREVKKLKRKLSGKAHGCIEALPVNNRRQEPEYVSLAPVYVGGDVVRIHLGDGQLHAPAHGKAEPETHAVRIESVIKLALPRGPGARK